jgi:hypothetical protein
MTARLAEVDMTREEINRLIDEHIGAKAAVSAGFGIS